MNSRLYARLAAQGMRKNGRFFLPYLLALIGTAAGFYIVAALAFDRGLENQRRAIDTMQGMMALGLVIIALFILIFVLYTNSFLFKRRKKELALYQILGMGRRHIAVILCYETLYTALIAIGCGVGLGIALFKAVQLALLRLLRFDVVFGLTVNLAAVGVTAVFFCGALTLLLALNLLHVRRVRPIELLRGAQTGEREPKARWLLTLLGLGTLGAGYWIALRTATAFDALNAYFLAVALVIAGTYCLFTSVSIAALKLLKRRRSFYYRPNHFISVSGMLYRMKQNAVGMANICVLSTMVMVMVSGTVSLYMGSEETVNNRAPADIMVKVRYEPTETVDAELDAALDRMEEMLKAKGIAISSVSTMSSLQFSALRVDGGFTLDRDNNAHYDSSAALVTLQFMSAEEYARLTGTEPAVLEADEVLVCDYRGRFPDTATFFMPSGANVGAATVRVRERLDSFPWAFNVSDYATDVLGVVLRDKATLMRFYALQQEAYDDDASLMRWEARINTARNDVAYKEVADLFTAWDKSATDIRYEDIVVLYEAWDTEHTGVRYVSLDTRADVIQDVYSLNGSFLFLGLFLGLVLLISTVLIIYYKQLSEGYDDKQRFEIMQKVGLSQAEARRTINRQILMVFFMPLLVAGLHILMDFHMMNQLLSLFSLDNTRLAILCSAGTFAVFSLVYGAVYLLTARTYYKIVQG